MSGNSPSRQRPLSADEAELWSLAMRDAKELKRRRRHSIHPVAAESVPAGSKDTAGSARVSPAARATAPATQQTPPSSISSSTAKTVPPLAKFEERQRRKLARDSDLIEARIDLHGMRQREAHSALRGFLFASFMRGHRHVLVITGKGRRSDADEERDFFREEPGILRRTVPLWLAEAEMRSIVVSFSTAHIRHGGEGALYVHLRKSPASG